MKVLDATGGLGVVKARGPEHRKAVWLLCGGRKPLMSAPREPCKRFSKEDGGGVGKLSRTTNCILLDFLQCWSGYID